MASKKRYDILNPIKKSDGRTFWTKVGVLFENRNGTLSGELEQIPLNGRMVVKEAEETNVETAAA